MLTKRLTANPVRPARYRPGKPTQESASSSEESELDEKEEDEGVQSQSVDNNNDNANQSATAKRPTTAVQSRLSAANRPNVKNYTLPGQQSLNEEEFVTDGSESEVDEGSITGSVTKAVPKRLNDHIRLGSRRGVESGEPTEEDEGEDDNDEEEEDTDDDDDDDDSTSDDMAGPQRLVRPIFVKKSERSRVDGKSEAIVTGISASTAAKAESESIRRRDQAETLVREEIIRAATERLNQRKAWDDEDEGDPGGVADEHVLDDTDDMDPEAEYAAWKLRQLKRQLRDRQTLEDAEREREEVDRRRNLPVAEREAEDEVFLAQQRADKEANRGQTAYLQKYHHRGAFFQQDSREVGLADRNVMTSKFVDEVDRAALPQYMQIRDMAKLGRKSRTKYKDLKAEDTGQWGEYKQIRTESRNISNAPFSGANAAAVGDRRKFHDSGAQAPYNVEVKRPRVDPS